MFFAQQECSKFVPIEFWTLSLKEALQEAIDNFKKYEEKIDKEHYLYDILRALVTF